MAKECGKPAIPATMILPTEELMTQVRKLASAGIDKNGRISGLPIKDDELYTVAVGEDIVKKGIIPESKSGINVRTINLDVLS